MTKLERTEMGHPLGVHRVLDKIATLPQAAEKLDHSLPIYSNEILIDVEKLNIDAASFLQMEQQTGKDPEKIAQIILENCRTRGKQQNRVTGSGGMLMGSIAKIGSQYPTNVRLKPGDRVATLVSLSLTPLHLTSVGKINFSTHQIDVSGHAILFEKSIVAALPSDIPESVATALFDVAGAPATVYGVARRGQTVVIIGAGGKAGVLSAVAARRKVSGRGKVIAIEPHLKACADLKGLQVCTELFHIDATDPLLVQSAVQKATRGKMADVVVNVAPVPDTELAAILCAKSRAKVIFFSMATSFTRVALGAEGIASDATLLVGNGYYPNHAKFALGLLRSEPALLELFMRRYNGG